MPLALTFRRFAIQLLLGTAIVLIAKAGAAEAAPVTLDNHARHVRILRDTWGVPHVFGESDADAAYGLAYAHAQDDFLTMQQTLLAARGRLATIYGSKAAPNDYMVQLLRIWDFVDKGYATDLDDATRAVLEGYAAGFNDYGRLHPEELISDEVLPVTGKDIVAGFVHKVPLFFGLDKALKEITGPVQAHPVSTPLPETTAPKTTPGSARREFASAEPTSFLAPMPSGEPRGSNCFALSPLRSADHWTRLNVNSHQPWEGPVAWYEAQIHSNEGWDMVGSIFPGSPFILHGHNQNLGWAHTVNNPDLIDIYVLTIDPENPDRYQVDGEWLDLEKRTAAIQVKLLGPLHWTFKRDVLWSIYGPVMRTDHGVYAIRFSNMGDLRYVEQGYRMNKARNFGEWKAAMSMLAMPMFNTAYADREGNIMYIYNGALPIRDPHYDWSQYLPGNTRKTLWTNYLPFNQLPSVVNPKSGFVINCNGSPYFTTDEAENPRPADFSPTLGIETFVTNRERRAMNLFLADDSITHDEFDRIKFDVAYDPDSSVGRLVRRILDAPEPDEPLLRDAVGILRSWDLETTPENRSAALAVLTTYPIARNWEMHADHSDTVPIEELWDSLRAAANELMKYHHRLDPEWQEVNRLVRGSVDLGVGGAPDVLHAVYGSGPVKGRLTGRAGDSYVLIAEWDTEGNVHSRSIHQYGSATLDKSSPHYADQAPLFVKCQMKDVWFDEATIRQHLESEYHPGEEPRSEKPGLWPW